MSHQMLSPSERSVTKVTLHVAVSVAELGPARGAPRIGAKSRAGFYGGAEGPFAYLAWGFTLPHRDIFSCDRSILPHEFLLVVERWGRKKPL